MDVGVISKPTVRFSGDDVQRSSTVTYTMLPSCECGCLLNQSSGYIVASSSTDCPSPRVWSVRVSDGLSLQLSFIRFNALHGTVRVHDGNSSLSNLLVQLDGGSAELPRPLTSAGNMLRVEYVLSAADLPVNDGGFVALFLAVCTYTLHSFSV